MIYDLFYVSTKQVDRDNWVQFKNRFPVAKLLENISEFNQIKLKSLTKFFWVVWEDVVVEDTFSFDYVIPKWDEPYIHVFLNGDTFDGICIFNKNSDITKKEFDKRIFRNKKDINIVASTPRPFNVFHIKTYEEYSTALNTSTTEMFWGIWPEVEIINEDIFSLYLPTYDRNENHVFKNLCNEAESYFNGIVLFSKNKPISKREFNLRYLIDKQEHLETASRYRYPRYMMSTYNDYISAINNASTPLFWGVWKELDIIDETVFDFYFDPRDGKYDHDRKENHVFKNIFQKGETFTNGLVLFSKEKQITQKEFNYRILVEKKEHNIVVSKLKPYDIIFISYNEKNADDNYQELLTRFPASKRVHGIKGIHQAHIEAAKLANTEMFWVVDADAIIEESFNFDYEVSRYDLDVVHVWSSRNPINDLVYGYGGVKLLPTDLALNIDVNSTDMTTSISSKFKAISEVSNVTLFNTDPFNTWKSAFRECVKLASKIIIGQNDLETEKRLEIWTTIGSDKQYGNYAISGAVHGKEYGLQFKNDKEMLAKINNFDWLLSEFKRLYE